MSQISRRELIVKAGVLALGAGVLQFGNGTPQAAAATDPKAAAAADPKTWPWPYEKLDPAKTAELAYNEWYRVQCGASVISSVFSQLAEKIGEPYKSFPVDGFQFLLGGMADWGTVCGTCAGSNTVVNLIIGPKVHGQKAGITMGSNLLHYYANTALPVYVPKNPKINPDLIPQTQSDSPLCHISVGKWMKKSGFPMSTPERKDRCARVAATMAYQVVENLNAWKDGKYNAEDIKWASFAESGGVV